MYSWVIKELGSLSPSGVRCRFCFVPPMASCCLIFKILLRFIYLFESVTQRKEETEREREISCVTGSHPKWPLKARSWALLPDLPHGCVGSTTGPSSAPSPGTRTGNRIRSGAAGSQSSSPVGCQHHRRELNRILHNADPPLLFLSCIWQS